jgi:DNA ligase-1
MHSALASAAGSAVGENADTLSLTDVNTVLAEIAGTKGQGSNNRRQELLAGLLTTTTTAGQRFLGRLILGELRHGALEGIMIEAVAKATNVPAADIRRAVMLAGDLASVAHVAVAEGLGGVRNFSLELFRPVQPMLAETANDVDEALNRLDVAALEYKLDGVRVQIHKDGDEVQVFTRHLNDVTANVPEVVAQMRRLQRRQIILDGEVLALRPDGRPHPFQTTMRRLGRKRDIDAMQKSLPLSVFLFDCLRLDEQSLIDQPTTERHRALSEAVDHRLLVPRLVTSDQEAAGRFLAEALGAGHEGIMAKSIESAYAAGGRGQSWLKIKPAHTLDLVILAAEWGSGRRKGWLSNLHLGARVAASGQFAMIGKTFKGLTDDMLAWQTEQLLASEFSRDEYTVYVEPRLVAEIAFNEVQASPHYASGYALRFARVKRYRSDKLPSEADTIDTVASIFTRQRG